VGGGGGGGGGDVVDGEELDEELEERDGVGDVEDDSVLTVFED